MSLRRATRVVPGILFLLSAAGPANAQNEVLEDQGDFRAVGPRTPHKYSELTSTVNSGLADGLNSEFALPHDIVLTSARCGQANAFFRSSGRDGSPEIVICEEIITDIVEEFQYDGLTDDELSTAIAANVIFILAHELGHALVHAYELPVVGREEDVVDQFATLIMSDNPTHAMWAAAFWLQRGDFGDTGLFRGLGRLISRNHFADEHSLNEQRFYNILCWVYGAAPESRRWIIQESSLPESRAVRCPREYAQMRAGWEQFLQGRASVDFSLSANEVDQAVGGNGERSQQTQGHLNSTYEIHLGDYAALLLGQFFEMVNMPEATPLVTYEPEPNKIDIELFGDSVGIEPARNLTSGVWSFVEDRFLPYMERRFGVSLEQSDFRVIYYEGADLGEESTPIIMLLDGRFVLP